MQVGSSWMKSDEIVKAAKWHRAIKEGQTCIRHFFEALSLGLHNLLREIDVKEFYSLPMSQAVWQKIKPYQDGVFNKFVDGCLK